MFLFIIRAIWLILKKA